MVGAARRHRVDGMIVGNTTVARPAWLRDQATAQEAGGLSGRPLFALATRMLAETYVRVEGAFPLVGVGGIDSGATALAKIRAGACLVQVYCALVFRGLGARRRDQAPSWPTRCARAARRPRRARRRRRRRDDGGAVAAVRRSLAVRPAIARCRGPRRTRSAMTYFERRCAAGVRGAPHGGLERRA